MKHLMSKITLLLVCLLAVGSQVSAIENVQAKRTRYQTIERPDLGYSIDIPRKWQLYREDEEDGEHASLYLGVYGEEFAGVIISVAPTYDEEVSLEEIVNELVDMDDVDEFTSEIVFIGDYEMLHVRATSYDEEQDFELEIDAYLALVNGKMFSIAYIATPAAYGKITESIAHSISTFQAI